MCVVCGRLLVIWPLGINEKKFWPSSLSKLLIPALDDEVYQVRLVRVRIYSAFFHCMNQSNKMHLELSHNSRYGAENVYLYHFIQLTSHEMYKKKILQKSA